MAVCKTCGKTIGDSATVCPHCGEQCPTTAVAVTYLIVVAVLVGLAVWFIFGVLP